MYDILYDYQKKIVDELKNFTGTGLFLDVGCGKSITSLALAEYKMQHNNVNKVVIICLCPKIEEWKADVQKFYPFHRVLELNGKKKNQRDFENGEWDFLIINFEKVWRNKILLAYVTERTFIIIDESHKIKEPSTKIGKFIQTLAGCTPHKTILTATPMGKGYIDLYNQLYFLGYINLSYKHFKERYCMEQLVYMPNSKPFYQIVGYKNTQELDYIVKQYCRFYERKVDEELIPSEIKVPIKIDEKYNKIARDRVYQDIVMDKVSRKRLGLKSLCSGTILGRTLVDIQGESLDRCYQLNTYKLDWLKYFLEDFKERVVVYYEYEHQRQQIVELCTKMKRTVASYCGEIKEKDKFLENDDCVIVVQYKSGGTGIDWLKLSYVAIFYSLPDSYIEFYQAKGRLHRHGQTKKPLFYLLVASGNKSADELNYQALMNKTDFNDDFFDRNFKQD